MIVKFKYIEDGGEKVIACIEISGYTLYAHDLQVIDAFGELYPVACKDSEVAAISARLDAGLADGRNFVSLL